MWIDCEMTGLRLDSDKLIEIAALVTDSELNVLGEGVDIVIHADDDALADMPTVVTEMHAQSGLTEEVRASTVDLAEAEERCSTTSASTSRPRAPRRWPATRSPPTADSSPATCPRSTHYLHYRMIDVSSIKELCRRWYPRIYFGQPEKGLAHRALADIKESIRELEVLPSYRVRRRARTVHQRDRRRRRRTGRPMPTEITDWHTGDQRLVSDAAAAAPATVLRRRW